VLVRLARTPLRSETNKCPDKPHACTNYWGADDANSGTDTINGTDLSLTQVSLCFCDEKKLRCQ